jgi:hypothetical protein
MTLRPRGTKLAIHHLEMKDILSIMDSLTELHNNKTELTNIHYVTVFSLEGKPLGTIKLDEHDDYVFKPKKGKS